jgi:hypothetical protein
MSVLWEGLVQGLLGVWTIARVVIPLMIVLEIAATNRILERVNRWTVPLFRLVGLSEAGAFPVVVATFFGLTFGSGVIISYIEEGRVSPREVRILGVFMALSHALVEDTALFLAVGAPIAVLLIPRLTAAFVCCWGLHRFLIWKNAGTVNADAVNS